MTVFIVLTHGSPKSLSVLVELLKPYPVVVHVDKRTKLDGYPVGDRIHYVRERVSVHWAGFSMVEATIRAYRLALTLPLQQREHLVLLSGSCVPLRPIGELKEFLDGSPVRQHCKAGLLLDGTEKNEKRLRRRWAYDIFDARAKRPLKWLNALLRKIVYIFGHPLAISEFDEFTVVAGSQWTALTVECVRDLLSDTDRVSRLRHLLRFSLAPDEIFFHTLLCSSAWRAQTGIQCLSPKGDRPTADFANLHFIDPSLTRYLGVDELKELRKTGFYFARKVDIAGNADAVDWLRCEMNGGAPQQ